MVCTTDQGEPVTAGLDAGRLAKLGKEKKNYVPNRHKNRQQIKIEKEMTRWNYIRTTRGGRLVRPL